MSVLAVILMALTPLLSKRYTAKWLYYAWLVIITGLIIPFRFHFTIPLFRVETISATVQHFIPARADNVVDAAAKIGTDDLGAAGIPWIQIVGILWLAGIAAFLIYHGLRHARFLRMVGRWSEQADDPQMLGMLESIKNDMEITKQVKLQICSCISSPMMIGFLNPVVLLPRSDFSVDELPYILRHELVHFKRKDLWYKCLVVLATAIHWFNPVVYLMARAIASQCEISCDAVVVNETDRDGRQRYSETIIGAIRAQSRAQTTSAEEQAKIDQRNRRALAKKYAIYEQYGLTYDQDTDNLYYNGKLVRYFSDKLSAQGNYNVFTCANGMVDIKTVRNANYELTGIIPVSQQEYDRHTESFNRVQSLRGTAQENGNDAVNTTNGSFSTEEADERDTIVTGSTFTYSGFAYSEGNPDYLDDSLNTYRDYGVSYDKVNNQWIFNNKIIHYLSDKDTIIYVDNSEDAVESNVSIEVIRTADGRIDKLREFNAARCQATQRQATQKEEGSFSLVRTLVRTKSA